MTKYQHKTVFYTGGTRTFGRRLLVKESWVGRSRKKCGVSKNTYCTVQSAEVFCE